MERGKQICRILKDIRVKIAQENDIEFITSECTHKGDCAGTCPKCEAEVRYLESQLARRHASGRQMRLAGISLGIAAIAPALVSCDSLANAGEPVPEMGDPIWPERPEHIQLGEHLIFDLIDHAKFIEVFAKGGWIEAEIYDVYPDGSLGDELLGSFDGYTSVKFAVKGNRLKYYRSYNSNPVHDYAMLDFFYAEWSNGLSIGNIHDYTVASIDDNAMVCYGPVFSQHSTPEAFLGKYVFRHVDEETVAGWDELHAEEAR